MTNQPETDHQVPGNQTEFTFEEPIFEAPPSLPGEKNTLPLPWYRRPVVLGGAAAVTVLLMVVAVMMPRSAPPTIEEEVLPSTSPLPAALSPLEQRLNQLKTELQAADPATQELPFPPVDMALELTEPRQ